MTFDTTFTRIKMASWTTTARETVTDFTRFVFNAYIIQIFYSFFIRIILTTNIVIMNTFFARYLIM